LHSTSQPLNIECHECALTVAVPKLAHKQKAICPRCKGHLTSFHHANLPFLVAFALTTLIFLLATLPFPFLSFSVLGQSHQMNISQGIATLIDHNFVTLAILQIVAIYLIPIIILSSLIALILPIILGKQALASRHRLFQLIFMLLPWSMAEIFLIGTLVSLIKMSSIVDITLGMSFYAYIAFSFFMVLTLSYLDKVALAKQLDITIPHRPKHPQNTQVTWALLITAVILYIPASMMPIMDTRLFGKESPSTIMEGVIVLWQHGSFPIAMIIFIASVFIPIAKIAVLLWLNYSIHVESDQLRPQRMTLYRITEFVGRWSMIDVFVVIILVSLVQLGNTMSIVPGPAAIAFSGVVIVTMLAAMSFDSQRIWQIERKDV
jgi:paraquat-inducible protein A